MNKDYYLYIMASLSGVLYIGMTNNLERRVYEHKNNLIDGFTKQFRCHSLMYYESSNDIKEILEREKQLKRWSRSKKVALIKKLNPGTRDLSTDFIESR